MEPLKEQWQELIQSTSSVSMNTTLRCYNKATQQRPAEDEGNNNNNKDVDVEEVLLLVDVEEVLLLLQEVDVAGVDVGVGEQ